MMGIVGNKLVNCPVISPAMLWLNVVNMTDNVIYLCQGNANDNSQPVITFGPYSVLSIPIYPEIYNNFKLFWENMNNPSLGQTAQFIFSYESLGYNQCYAESFAYAGGKLGITVENTPAVNATISGTADVNIANTPNVAISSGSVDATIQNATLNSQIVNLSTEPVQAKPAIGVYDSANIINAFPVGGTRLLVLPAGNYLSKVRLSVWYFGSNQGNRSVFLQKNTDTIYADFIDFAKALQIDIDFGTNGVYNNGIWIYCDGVGSYLQVTGVVCTSANTPRPACTIVT